MTRRNKVGSDLAVGLLLFVSLGLCACAAAGRGDDIYLYEHASPVRDGALFIELIDVQTNINGTIQASLRLQNVHLGKHSTDREEVRLKSLLEYPQCYLAAEPREYDLSPTFIDVRMKYISTHGTDKIIIDRYECDVEWMPRESRNRKGIVPHSIMLQARGKESLDWYAQAFSAIILSNQTKIEMSHK